ncbi:Aldo-keto reductase family 4 member C11 [Platanthera guangdongensis]|uniref:Aldo-keto reductase family 4 member C11 n=1 Tax=Platanthera guangdongensis TaxID=2320717 RepID=A0ABR2M2F9_9ASPA
MREKGPTIENYFVLNTGAKIPAIGLGTWQSGGDIFVDDVTTTLKIGYHHIDCAHMYGNEIEVGKALTEAFDGGIRREDYYISLLYKPSGEP